MEGLKGLFLIRKNNFHFLSSKIKIVFYNITGWGTYTILYYIKEKKCLRDHGENTYVQHPMPYGNR